MKIARRRRKFLRIYEDQIHFCKGKLVFQRVKIPIFLRFLTLFFPFSDLGKNFQISYPNFSSSDLGKNSQISYPKFSADLNLGKISYPFG